MNISDESTIFNKVTFQYILTSTDTLKSGWTPSSRMKIEYNYDEILEVAKHHAMCGENVYLVAFPRNISIGVRPNTLFFLDTFEEMIDVSSDESGLVLLLTKHESGFAYYSAVKHLSINFKLCSLILLEGHL